MSPLTPFDKASRALIAAIIAMIMIAVVYYLLPVNAKSQITNRTHTHKLRDHVGPVDTDQDIVLRKTGLSTITCSIENDTGVISCSGVATSAIYIGNVFATDVFITQNLYATGSIYAQGEVQGATGTFDYIDVGGGYALTGCTLDGAGNISCAGDAIFDGTLDSATATLSYLYTGGGFGSTGCTLDDSGNAICDGYASFTTYYGDGSALTGVIHSYSTPTLQIVTDVGATTTTMMGIGGGYGSTGCSITDAGDVLCDGDVSAAVFFGDGSNLTGIATPTLAQVLASGNTASATVIVDSVLAGNFYGDGSGLTLVDADTLDTHDSTYFATATHEHTLQYITTAGDTTTDIIHVGGATSTGELIFASATFGGGYGDTGVTINTNGDVFMNGKLYVDGAIDPTDITFSGTIYGGEAQLATSTFGTPGADVCILGNYGTLECSDQIISHGKIFGGTTQDEVLELFPNVAKLSFATPSLVFILDEETTYWGALSAIGVQSNWGIENDLSDNDLSILYDGHNMAVFATNTQDILTIMDGTDAENPVVVFQKDGDIYASGSYYGDGSTLSGITSATPTLSAVLSAGNTASQSIFLEDVYADDINIIEGSGYLYLNYPTNTVYLNSSSGQMQFSPFYVLATSGTNPNIYVDNQINANGITISKSAGTGTGITVSNSSGNFGGSFTASAGTAVYAEGKNGLYVNQYHSGGTYAANIIVDAASLAPAAEGLLLQQLAPSGGGNVMRLQTNEGGTKNVMIVGHGGNLAIGPSAAVDTTQAIFVTSATSTAGVKIENTSEAASGTTLTFYHNSASPEINDTVNTTLYQGENSAGGAVSYGKMDVDIIDPTGGGTGRMCFYVLVDGTETKQMCLTENGVTIGSSESVMSKYEEGTWTPEYHGGTNAGDCTASTTAYGYYTQTGNMITANGYILVEDCVDDPTGIMNITLPVAAKTATSYGGGCSYGFLHNYALSAENIMTLVITSGDQFLELYQTPAGGGAGTAVDLDEDWNMYFTCSYLTD